jgi:RNA polymerase sigma-70 factor, ECF subfamily
MSSNSATIGGSSETAIRLEGSILMEQAASNELEYSTYWIDHLRKGGQTALAEAFMAQRARLRRMVCLRMDRRVARRIDASDVLQETYLEASQRLDEYLAEPRVSLFVWLRFLAAQRLMGIHRQHLGTQKRDVRQEMTLAWHAKSGDDSHAPGDGLLAAITSPSMAAVRHETQAQLLDAVDGLDPQDREILALRHYEQLSNREAAEELGITTAAASKRYIRALERLKGSLSETPEFRTDGKDGSISREAEVDFRAV